MRRTDLARRQWLRGGAALAALGAAGQALGQRRSVRADTGSFYMPDEGEPHARTWMAFTTSRAIWGADLPAVQRDLMRIADTVAAFEPVTMLVNREGRARAEALRATAHQRLAITLVDAALDDLWMRDTGPVFVRSEDGKGLRAIDFNFNGWGQKQGYGRDATVAGFVARQANVPITRAPLVLEGGGIEVDGEGTAIVKESCVLNANRNPGMGKRACEEALKEALGLDKVVWLPGPAGGDITDAHTDFYARFAGNGVVVVSHDAQDTYGERRVTQAHIDTLRAATDSQSRRLRVEVIPVPEAPDSAHAGSDSFAAGYINYYLCNGGLVLPAFGDTKADSVAARTLARLYPERHLVALRIDAIAAGGGGIHCTTQQQPSAQA